MSIPSQEREDEGHRQLAAHYKELFENAANQHHYYKSMLYDAWKALRGQSKGLQRQSRKIKRLRAKVIELEIANRALHEQNKLKY